MIGIVRKHLADLPVYLASSSPRRQEILRNVSFPFEVRPSKFPETLDKTGFEHPFEYAVENAVSKALDVAAGVDRGLIIGADTIVVHDDKILEKPKDVSDAESILSRLSGSTHQVVTGVSLVLKKEHGRETRKTFHVTTIVNFAKLSEEVIRSYVQTGEPMDKAGAYGIQGLGGTLIESIHGDYYNVVGLPLHSLCEELILLLTNQT